MIQFLSEFISPLNKHFSQFICRIAHTSSQELALASALVSYWTERGHICISLNDFSATPIDECLDFSARIIDKKDRFICPALNKWQEKLTDSGVVGFPGEKKPLILDHSNRLYLYRYYQYEHELSKKLILRSQQDVSNLYISGLSQFMDRLFIGDAFPSGESPQRKAVEIAIKKKLCIVSGGPGTGKTSVAAKIIAALIHVAETPPRIDLTAPTGKAAQRLQESLLHAQKELNCSEEIISAMPNSAMTIHRLLGPVHRSPYFKHNAENPLPSDAVIVDEASMIDLALMHKLTMALRPESRLIILGDKDQLASVDPGSVLGDICLKPSENKKSSLQSSMVFLTKNYRFGELSGIFKAANAVNQGNPTRALEIIEDVSGYPDISWRDIQDIKNIKNVLKDDILYYLTGYLKQKQPYDALMALNTFRILCAVRKGPFGVERFNSYVSEILASKGLIQANKRWYHGRPIMITKNDPTVGLYNGDIGLIFKDKTDQNTLKAFFIGSDDIIKKYLPARLPEHETVFAMTVHKSQGSEFDHVLFVLPNTFSKVLTRELMYTGLTRTRKSIDIWGKQSIFCTAVKNRIHRQSGLSDAIWYD
ncbi:exonuclease V subunit alpha [Candidatus Magnetomorum sp. HK-1]|nr:exonuclease V subunit alpha [Candidatus Magnetomorum sp. HK-1]